MNTILPLNRMAELLAARTGIDTITAENFIVRFFETVESGLSADDTVTVKGFGTFRRDGDSVVFDPADEFAAKVNAPFEMFAPVEIGEGVDTTTLFAAMDTSDAEEPVAPEEEHTVPEEEPAPVEESVAIEEEPTDPEEDPIEGKQPVIVPIVVEEPTAAEVEVESDTRNDEPNDGEDVADEEDRTSMSDVPPVVVYRRGLSRCCVVLWLIVGLVVGMIVGLFGGYLGRDKIDALLGVTEAHPQLPTDSVSETVAAQPVDTMPVSLTDDDIADINDPTTDPEIDKDPETIKPAVSVEVYDTITSRRFLTTMARKYYGHQDYWVYIYKANAGKLRHPDRIRPGTRVLIPDFEKYRTSPDPEQNRTDARREGVRIYEKYK